MFKEILIVISGYVVIYFIFAMLEFLYSLKTLKYHFVDASPYLMERCLDFFFNLWRKITFL
jgi:hypothetical protein